MSRSAHTYRLGDIEVVLTVPEGVRVPRVLALKHTADAADAVFEHFGVKAVRARAKAKPRASSKLAKISSDWAPPVDEVVKLRAECPSVNTDFETAQFVDWSLSKGESRADWLAAWRGWIRRTHKQNVERGWKPSSATPRQETGKQKWLREHGVTEAEFESKKDDVEWVKRIERRGVVG